MSTTKVLQILGSIGKAPVFDLSEAGLPNIPYGNQEGVELETDTTEIMAALAKGAVTFKVNLAMGEMVEMFVATVNPICIESVGQYMCAAYMPMVSDLDCLMIVVMEGGIWANSAPISVGEGEEIPPASIDLSGLESSGQIIETYADGSAKTTQLEFDASGNPTKITDGDGNVTTLIW